MIIKSLKPKMDLLELGVVQQVKNHINQSGEKPFYFLLKLEYESNIFRLLLTQNELLRARRVYAPQLACGLTLGWLYDFENSKITVISTDGNKELIAMSDTVITAASGRYSNATGDNNA